MTNTETLVSLPPAAARLSTEALGSAAFADSDPPGRQLGSGGGTAWLLLRAWRAAAPKATFREWLGRSGKLIIHASGQSRRLPAYAAEGKSRLPIPRADGRSGQTFGQTLLDLQETEFRHLLRHAPDSYRLAVACGDTLVRYPGPMPRFPEADVLILGIPSTPEEASAHGVLFTPIHEPGKIEFFLQKPAPDRIAKLASSYTFSLDSGVWLFSERAVRVLLRKCGIPASAEAKAPSTAELLKRLQPYDLYDRFGEALGEHPANPDPDIATLTAAVLPLPDGRFFHFGTNRSVLSSVAQLSHPAEGRHAFGHAAPDGGDRVILHAEAPCVPDSVRPLWIENASVPGSWTLSGEHVLTGIPDNAWAVSLPRGTCVDAVPFDGRTALRVYGFDDAFKGRLADASTRFLGRPFTDWLAARGLTLRGAKLDPGCDLQNAPIFPLVDFADPAGAALLQWMAGGAESDESARKAWLAAKRVSATDLVQKADLAPRLAAREARVRRGVEALTPAEWADLLSAIDLRDTKARGLAPKNAAAPAPAGLPGVHDAMFRGDGAFARLQDLILSDQALEPCHPHRNMLEDQIVWGRSPARLDLAGGWTDTPPYCLEHGGCVVNVAVDLNGQPPIQAFVRIRKDPVIVLHSIDLGVSETIETFENLCAPSALGPFSIPRAALRLAGFDPRFHGRGCPKTLKKLLQSEFGGGLEISTLAAIPKGSGLGTSSIISATVLGVIGEACALGWTQQDLFDRTTALEQMLGAGGGWQDQLGGIVGGVKKAMTRPGVRQTPDIRFLPDGLLADLIASGRAGLYYTGVTRLARNILAGIVENLFLGDRTTMSLIEDIGHNAEFTAHAIEHADEDGLFEGLRRSWALNRELDAGTCPPSLEPVTSVLEKNGASFKLLGAGGGGYLLFLTKTRAQADAIREELTARPPNPRARFISISLSRGLQITRS